MKNKLSMSMKEFKKGAKPADDFIRVTKEIAEKESKKLIDEDRLKRDRAWSKFGHQIVGAEDF